MKRLSLKTENCEVADRQFTLREHAGEDVEEYIRLMTQWHRACAVAVTELREATAESITEAAGRVGGEQLALLRFILAHPDDGKGTITQEWITKNISSRMVLEIFSWQDELNQLSDFWGKMYGALMPAEPSPVTKNANTGSDSAESLQPAMA